MNVKPNPYEPARAHPVAPTKEFRVNHSQALNFVFESPSWIQNILLLTLCVFIPIVGPIVVYGYQFEMIEYLHRSRGSRYPDFTFNRFSEYLSRGLWVFLVALIINLVAIPLIWGIMFGGIVVIGLVAGTVGPDAAGMSMILTVPFFVVAMVTAWVFMAIIMAPMLLGAGLAQDFGQGFNMSFISEFISNTWKQIIVSTLVVVMVSFATTLVGALAVCIGMYFAMSYMMMVMAHLGWQMYELHLSKGGARIPLKPVAQ